MSRCASKRLRGSLRYSTGLAASFTRGYRRDTLPTPPSTTPASSPQHSLGLSDNACASIASYRSRGTTSRNGIDKVRHPSETEKMQLVGEPGALAPGVSGG